MTFLDRFESADHTIKRDLDSTNDEVRVMTVHGAKGLEAPLVFLFDGCAVKGADPILLELPTGGDRTVPVWSPGKAYDSDAIAAARALCQDKAAEEHNRLLYVAMTRAKDRLVVAPYLTSGKNVQARGMVGDDPARAGPEAGRARAGRGALRSDRDLAAGPAG